MGYLQPLNRFPVPFYLSFLYYISKATRRKWGWGGRRAPTKVPTSNMLPPGPRRSWTAVAGPTRVSKVHQHEVIQKDQCETMQEDQ